MFCKHCGQQIDDSSNACPNCGTGVTRKYSDTNPTGTYNSQVASTGYYNPDTKMTVHMSAPYQAPEPKKKKSGAKKIIIAIIALILVAAIVGGIFFFLKYQEKKKEEEILAHQEKLEDILKESTTKPIIEMYYEDYDSNGSTEAYAIVGENGKGEGEDVEYTNADIYFVNEKAAQPIAEKVSGETNGILTSGDAKYISLENEKSADDSYSYIYGVKADKPFESATSGMYHEVHQDGDKIVGKKEKNGDFVEITVSSDEIVLKADYEDVINQYREVVKNRLDLEDSIENFGEYVSNLMTNHLRYAHNYGNRDSETIYRIYYATFDLNDDGIDECVFGKGEDKNTVTVYSIFTHDRRNPIPLFEVDKFGERTHITIYDNGTLYVDGSNGASSHSYYYYNLPKNASEVSLIEEFAFEDYDYFRINTDGSEEKLTDESFHSIQNDYKSNEIKFKWNEIKYGEEDPGIIPDPEVGDIIEFGYYPQSKVTDADVISQLNTAAINWFSYGYYSAATAAEQEKGINMVKGDYMQYTDVMYAGEKYRGVKFSQYRPYYISATPTADKSYQDDNGYNVNTVYWFKYEPIEWQILDPETGLVVCKTVIDSQPFSNTIYLSKGNYYSDIDNTYFTNDYSNSSLRNWLNTDFFNTAFESYLQEEIQHTTCANINPENSSHTYPNTYDRIFLLSYDDITNESYGFSPDGTSQNKERLAKSTDYAQCQGTLTKKDGEISGNSSYWLRSPCTDSREVWGVSYVGDTLTNQNHNDTDSTDCGVRPAMRLAELTLL